MLNSFLNRLQKMSGSPAYPFWVAILVAVDLFILVLPNDVLLASAVAANPKRWVYISLVVTMGSCLGAFLLFGLARYDQQLIHEFFPTVFHSSHWETTESFFANFGGAATFIGAVGPLPLQLFVIVGALTKSAAFPQLLGIFLGRLVKYLFVAYCIQAAPDFLRRFRVGRRWRNRRLKRVLKKPI